MPVQKIKSGRVLNPPVGQFIGEHGVIFYDESLGDLRLSDGHTPGGIPLLLGGGSSSTYVLVTATNTTLGGIKVGANLSIAADGTLNANTSTVGVSDSFRTFTVAGNADLVATGADTVEFVAGVGIVITTNAAGSPYKTITLDNNMFNATVDGGVPNSVYGGLAVVDGGGI
jgi:hypothetical protein